MLVHDVPPARVVDLCRSLVVPPLDEEVFVHNALIMRWRSLGRQLALITCGDVP